MVHIIAYQLMKLGKCYILPTQFKPSGCLHTPKVLNQKSVAVGPQERECSLHLEPLLDIKDMLNEIKSYAICYLQLSKFSCCLDQNHIIVLILARGPFQIPQVNLQEVSVLFV